MKITKQQDKKNNFKVIAYTNECGYDRQVWYDVTFIPKIGDYINFPKRDNMNVSNDFKVLNIIWCNNGKTCMIRCGNNY